MRLEIKCLIKISLKSVNEFIMWQYEEFKIIEEVSVSNEALLVNQATWSSPSRDSLVETLEPMPLSIQKDTSYLVPYFGMQRWWDFTA